MHPKRAIIATFFVFFVLFTLSIGAWAQDAHFSQFYANPLYTNPATAGVTYADGGGRVGINYRNQWKGKFTYTAVSWDQEFIKLKGGIGVIISNDQSNFSPFSATSVSAIYSFKHKINKKLNLYYGLQTELRQQVFDWSQIRFQDQIDPAIGFINPTNEPWIPEAKSALNFSLGVLAKHEDFFAGMALHNLTQPIVSFRNLENKWVRRYSVHGGYNYEFKNNKDWQLSPQVLLMKQDKSKQMEAGVLAGYKFIYAGAFYRHTYGRSGGQPTDIIGVVGFKTKRWRFAYSYDKVISDLGDFLVHSHELSLSFAYCNKKVSKETHKGLMW